MLRQMLMSFILFVSLNTSAQVWVDTNKWTPEWETKFASWVKTTWAVDAFSRHNLADGKENPFYGLMPDCADTVYSMRIIFAYNNKLPIVINDPTGGTKKINNRMTRYNHLSNPNARARAFLADMFDTISTSSLPRDTYPVAISKETIHAGGLLMTTHAKHHSWTIKDILPIGVPYLVFNSVRTPYSTLGLMQSQSWPNPESIFQGDKTPAGNAGFRYWRKEEDLDKPVWQVPGYSEEQYKIPLANWTKYIEDKLASTKESDEEKIKRLFDTACTGMQGRVQTVNEAVQFLEKNGNKCIDYATYDSYSTPNRDHRIFDDLVALRKAYQIFVRQNGATNVPSEARAQLNKIFPAITKSIKDEAAMMSPQDITSYSTCFIEYGPGKKMDLAEAKRRLFAGLISSNPLDDLAYRWGEKRGPSSRAAACQSWDPWSPDLEHADL